MFSSLLFSSPGKHPEWHSPHEGRRTAGHLQPGPASLPLGGWQQRGLGTHAERDTVPTGGNPDTGTGPGDIVSETFTSVRHNGGIDVTYNHGPSEDDSSSSSSSSSSSNSSSSSSSSNNNNNNNNN